MNDVSVIVPCNNAAAWIRETLTSVRSAGPGVMETIVVDDGSADESAAIVARDFPEMRLVRTSNRGASAARNLGTSLASGRYLQYLDADDLLRPEKIARQRALLDATGADVAYGQWRRLSGAELGPVISRRLPEESAAVEVALFLDFWAPPAAYLFRRALVERLPGWNERLPVIQDARFALDCALYGGRFVYLPEVVAHYREHGDGSLSRRNPKAFYRDIYRNGLEIEAWWREHGGLTPERREALVRCIAYTARQAAVHDRSDFAEIAAELDRLRPGFVPDRPRHLRLASRLFGYQRAETMAHWYRRLRGRAGYSTSMMR